jgi:hypothetical protein
MPLCPTSFLLCPLPYAMTHLCSLYTIGPPLPHCDYHITLDSVYIDEVHSLYSLVLISQDFLFSCLNLCELAVGTSFVLPPSSPLLSPSSPHCQDLVTGLYGCLQALVIPLYPTWTPDTVSQPLVPFGLDPYHVSSLCGGMCTSVTLLSSGG